MKLDRTLIQELSTENRTMHLEIDTKKHSTHYLLQGFAVAVLVMIVTSAVFSAEAPVKRKEFPSAEEAVKAFVAAVKADDDKELLAIFGSKAKDLIFSGDPVSDKERRKRCIAAYDQKNNLAKDGDKMIIIIGENEWPFPIPVVQQGEKWVFDTNAGKEEILNRRIGQNELYTIQSLLAIVDAQREYAMADQDGNGLLEYAEKFWSDPGKRNGLYWETKEDEEPSPLGELIVNAMAGGYKKKDSKHNPVSYQGYYYRMLHKQGKHASGGAFDYKVKGNQIGGFAVIAYPAKYGNSGVMTFVVNHEGVVYQKNIGRNSAKTAKAMTIFDPDKTWKKIQ